MLMYYVGKFYANKHMFRQLLMNVLLLHTVIVPNIFFQI